MTTIKKDIETIKKTRIFLLDLIKDLSVEDLNKIPAGFNNNIIWNVAHLVAAQQGICYLRAGLKTPIQESFFHEFKPGTKPEKLVDSLEIGKIKNLFLETIDQLEVDYSKEIFQNYKEWVTRYGVTLSTIDDAISFLIFHEGLHGGYIMALKKAINIY